MNCTHTTHSVSVTAAELIEPAVHSAFSVAVAPGATTSSVTFHAEVLKPLAVLPVGLPSGP